MLLTIIPKPICITLIPKETKNIFFDTICVYSSPNIIPTIEIKIKANKIKLNI